MNREKFKVEYLIYENAEECSAEVQLLFEKAKEAMDRAYSPYSGFRVGAALMLENGEIFTGNNQENAAYPSGLCAERVAIFAAKSLYPEVAIEFLVIVTSAENPQTPVSPCGSCRQVMVEYEHLQKKPFLIYLESVNHSIVCVPSAQFFLPFNFNSDVLNS